MEHLAIWAALLLSAEPAAKDADETKTGGAAEAIAVDWIHANDFSMIGLQPGVYQYHVLCGFHRAFGYLESRGLRCRYLTEGPLTLEQLQRHRLLFINLVSAEREPFLVSEIEAINAFVANGGSLLIITDHSNCYFHSHRLKPLLTSLGIASSTTTACDETPRTLDEGNAWITVTSFRQHPVTDGLRCIAFQTGGCVDSRYAVALTSDRSWADEWSAGIYGRDNSPGFLGDLVRAPDEVGGPLGVVLAKDHQQGRILIAADQNMFADDFLNYADNYRLWLNSIAWLLHDASLPSPVAYQRWKSPRLWLFEQFESAEFGRSSDDGFHSALSLVNRYFFAFTGDRPIESPELIVFARNGYVLNREQRTAVADHLKRGRNVLVLGGASAAASDSRGVVSSVLAHLSASPAPVQSQGGMRWDIPGGGRIEVLRDDLTPRNMRLPRPTRTPDEREQQHNDALLDTLRSLL